MSNWKEKSVGDKGCSMQHRDGTIFTSTRESTYKLNRLEVLTKLSEYNLSLIYKHLR